MVAFILFFIAFTLLWFREFIPFGFQEKRRVSFRFKPLKAPYKAILENDFSYYKSLDVNKKKLFEARVQAFIDSKQFIPRGYTHITDQMKVLIAGAAIQLTFGFKHIQFSHFKKILVYPDDYYSRITRKYHQGEVNRMGLVVFSWSNFTKGYDNESDGINLGLHEMAHALHLENAIENEEYGFIDKRVFSLFHKLAKTEMQLMKSGQNYFFRHYGSTNIHEFFAIAVENFFERPTEFYNHNPDLYDCMSKLLKQNTLGYKNLKKEMA